ncbi:MAG: Gfo/Idh/MocA family oxidoreductase [Chloroflexi bacterium]|nr:Gfo/Idh/MocA family oxidoreductase [Chloroflexota bacterium]
MRLGVGQLGTRHGHAAGKWAALCGNPDVEAVGIWEPDPSLRGRVGFAAAHWFTSADALLKDARVAAVAIEGRNDESLAMATAAVAAGKHLWFDKPAGADYQAFQQLMAAAVRQRLHVQMGYMFRYSPGFGQVADLVRSGALGDIFAARAHMSTRVDLVERTAQSRQLGGILYDLGGHMFDQIVWLLGRPLSVQSVLRNDTTPTVRSYADNSVCVLQFAGALAVVDIAAADLYARELQAFVSTVRGERRPDRSPEHELLVQETLLRATGAL